MLHLSFLECSTFVIRNVNARWSLELIQFFDYGNNDTINWFVIHFTYFNYINLIFIDELTMNILIFVHHSKI